MRHLTIATELGMLGYWAVAAALALGLLSIDPALMYSNYRDPVIAAWNWSFFPIDFAFAMLGLAAKSPFVSDAAKLRLATISATLMLCAGLMAVSFWALSADFKPLWWAMNLWLVALGLANLLLPALCPEPRLPAG